jgi:hypothetical protein
MTKIGKPLTPTTDLEIISVDSARKNIWLKANRNLNLEGYSLVVPKNDNEEPMVLYSFPDLDIANDERISLKEGFPEYERKVIELEIWHCLPWEKDQPIDWDKVTIVAVNSKL